MLYENSLPKELEILKSRQSKIPTNYRLDLLSVEVKSVPTEIWLLLQFAIALERAELVPVLQIRSGGRI